MEEIVNKVAKPKLISFKAPTQEQIAAAYFRMVCGLYGVHISPTEAIVLAYTAIYQTISTPPAREAFVRDNDSSLASLGNFVSKLQQKKLLYKDSNRKIRVIPSLNKLIFDKTYYQFKINMEVVNGEV